MRPKEQDEQIKELNSREGREIRSWGKISRIALLLALPVVLLMLSITGIDLEGITTAYILGTPGSRIAAPKVQDFEDLGLVVFTMDNQRNVIPMESYKDFTHLRTTYRFSWPTNSAVYDTPQFYVKVIGSNSGHAKTALLRAGYRIPRNFVAFEVFTSAHTDMDAFDYEVAKLVVRATVNIARQNLPTSARKNRSIPVFLFFTTVRSGNGTIDPYEDLPSLTDFGMVKTAGENKYAYVLQLR